MSEMEDKLNAILSSPEAMEQIMALANSLRGGGGNGEDSASSEPQNASPEPLEATAPPTPPPDLSALLSAFGGEKGSSSDDGSSLFGQNGLDPAMIANLMALMREYNRNDDQKTALLLALKPFLREERRAKVDRAIQIARLSRVIRAALQLFKGGEADV